MRRFSAPFALLVLLSGGGCSGEKKPGPAPVASPIGPAGVNTLSPSPAKGEVSLHLEPKEIAPGIPVHISGTGFPFSGTTVEWLVNGEVVPAGGKYTLDTTNLRRNDSIQARAMGPWGVAESGIVAVGNSPPEIRRVGFVPPEHKTGRPLSVEAEGYDADGDSVRFDIVWQINGEPAGTGERMSVPVRGGDKIVVTITPFDGESYGQTATLRREIRNQVIIERQEQFETIGNVLTFRIVASGDGGTPLTYALKDAPSGMRIDPATGWVRWEAAAGLTGKVPFGVLVSDGAGAEATARFTVTIPEDEPSVPK